jgi:hypothetical protein
VAAVLTLGACDADDGPDTRDGEATVTDPAGTDPVPTAPVGAETPEQQIAADLFERANDERRERGLDPLEWNEDLAQLAREWSEEMSITGEIQHRDIDVDLIQDIDGLTGLGENLFTSTAPVPAGRAHEGWMRSPGHRANLLSPDWDLLGIGVVCADDGEHVRHAELRPHGDGGSGGGAGSTAGGTHRPPPVRRPELLTASVKLSPLLPRHGRRHLRIGGPREACLRLDSGTPET